MHKVWVENGLLSFRCPGCGEIHDGWNVGARAGRPRWVWSGDEDRPTLSPSLVHKVKFSSHRPYVKDHCPGKGEHCPAFQDTICHSFIRSGRIQFLGDCTHHLAGRTVDLPEVYEGATLELMRHKRDSVAKDCATCKWYLLPTFADDGDCIGPCHDCGFGEHNNDLWEAANLLASGDTAFTNIYSEYVAKIEAHGFELAYRKGYGDEFLCVYVRGGFVLCFDTYGDNINGAKLYYNWVPNEDIPGGRYQYTSSGGFKDIDTPDECWCGDHDGREALFLKMRGLEENGTILPQWRHRPFLWFRHYSEKGSDYRAATGKVIAEATEQLRSVMGV